MAVTNANTFSTTGHIENHQPGFGTLSRLSVEIRLMIRQQRMPEAGSGDGNRGPQALRSFCTVAERQTYQMDYPANLSILRASRYLYLEVMEELYRNRVLTICFNSEIHDRWDNPLSQAMLYIKIGGVCRSRDFQHTDFSKFSSLKLDIRFPSEDDP